MKKYVRPEMKVVLMEPSSALLAASSPQIEEVDYYDEYTDAPALSRKNGFKSLWDED